MNDIINRIASLHEQIEYMKEQNQKLEKEYQCLSSELDLLKEFKEAIELVLIEVDNQMNLALNTKPFLRQQISNKVLIGLSIYALTMLLTMFFDDFKINNDIVISKTLSIVPIMPACFLSYFISTYKRRKLEKNLPDIKINYGQLKNSECILIKRIARWEQEKANIIKQMNTNDNLIKTFEAYIAQYNTLLNQLVETKDLEHDYPEIDTNLKLELENNFVSL